MANLNYKVSEREETDLEFSAINFSPFHHVFVLVEPLALIPHEVQDSRGGLLFKSSALSTET